MKKQIFFLISTAFLWMSCSMAEHPVSSEAFPVNEADRDRVALEALELRQMFYGRVTDRLKHHLPVYTSGCNSNRDGHAYVIDGFVEQKKYIDDFAMRRRSLLHVNWGWGSFHNGWFLADMLDKNKKVTDFDENAPMYRYGSTPGMYDGRAITITYRMPWWMQ